MTTAGLDVLRLLHYGGGAALICTTLPVWLPGRWQYAAALVMLSVSAASLLSEIVLRSVWTGRIPVVGTYENTLVVAAMLAIACVVALVLAAPSVRLMLVRLTIPWAIVALAFGLRFSSEPISIGVEGRGLLAYAHALVGWLDFTTLLVATMASVGMLINRRADASAWQPIVTRALGAGFALLTATIASGAVLSFGVFGSWYQWQIVETLAAALWLLYGLLLHAYLLFGWRDRRLALLIVGVLPLAIAAFWSWALYPGTYHFFERVLGS